jgi:FtsH-binding integral membrane protein
MFIGHFAVALAAKRAAPEVSLGTLFLAAQLADLVWPTLVLLGLEAFAIRPGITAVTPLDFIRYPYSHSLVALGAWGAALGIAYFLWKRKAWPAAVVFAVVLSHWLLDFITHRPDLPLTLAGAERFGLGLWHSRIATLAVEGTLFGACVWLYARTTRPLDRAGRWSFIAFVAFLVVVYLANLFGPPPPSVAAVAWTAQAIWLLVAWGYWIDRHRAASRN